VAKTFKTRRDAAEWHQRYDPLAPKVGDVAPDFQLSDVNGENPVRLSQFRGKSPVALVFGSFT
jgi:hypothetical protein